MTAAVTVYLVKTIIPMTDTTLDPATNHWVWAAAGAPAANYLDANALGAFTATFYNTKFTGQTQAVGYYMGTAVNVGAGIEYSVYDITNALSKGQKMGAPLAQGGIAWGTYAPSQQGIGEGVAAVLSFRRDYGSDVEFVRDSTGKVIARPRMQDRGRIYLGPLGNTAITMDTTTHRTKLAAAFLTDYLIAFNKTNTSTANGTVKFHLSQWSKVKGNVADITQVWCDDRPDYQRRRADQSTAKTFGSWAYT